VTGAVSNPNRPVPWWGWALAVVWAAACVRSAVLTVLNREVVLRGQRVQADADVAWLTAAGAVALGLALPTLLNLLYKRTPAPAG
jgi:hypothetical protein